MYTDWCPEDSYYSSFQNRQISNLENWILGTWEKDDKLKEEDVNSMFIFLFK